MTVLKECRLQRVGSGGDRTSRTGAYRASGESQSREGNSGESVVVGVKTGVSGRCPNARTNGNHQQTKKAHGIGTWHMAPLLGVSRAGTDGQRTDKSFYPKSLRHSYNFDRVVGCPA